MLKRIWSFSTLFVLFMCITASYKSSALGNTSNPRISRNINASEIFWRGKRPKKSSAIFRIPKADRIFESGIYHPTSLPILTDSIDSSSTINNIFLDKIKKTVEVPNLESTISSLSDGEPVVSIPTKTRSHSVEKSTELKQVEVQTDEKKTLVPTPVAPTTNVEASHGTELEAKPSSLVAENATEDKGSQTENVKDNVQVENNDVVEDELNVSISNEKKTPIVESEEMPSFDEWKKKMLAEHQQNEGIGGKPVQIPSIPGKKLGATTKRRRNYASSECGAKIVASNNEAEAPSRILNEQEDMYMLNPCKAKIWFIIELCDTIQAAQFELANFELFSSLPRDFSLYWSDRFPTREWTPLGTFFAPEQRVLHSFDLKQHGYGKFLKVELHSYYGREHYCPLSLVRVYGTSMVDEYEEMETDGLHLHAHVAESDKEIMDGPAFQQPEEDSTKNLFGSARDAVLNIVRKAARALGREDFGATPVSTESSLRDANIINMDEENASFPITINKTTHSLWRNTAGLGLLLDECGLCVESEEASPCFHSHKCLFFLSIFNISTIAQFCQTTACSLASLPFNNQTISTPEPQKETSKPKFETEEPRTDHTQLDEATTSIINSTDSVIYVPPISEDSTAPEIRLESQTADSSAKISNLASLPTVESQEIPNLQSSLTDFSFQPILQSVSISSPSPLISPSAVAETETIASTLTPTLDDENLLLDDEVTRDSAKKDQIPGHIEISQPIPIRNLGVVIPTGQKESVFMRLSNRIKILEMNMSLSSLYLQELSQRYRRQMEDMQRGFNRTVAALNDTAQLAESRDKQQQEAIKNLQVIVMDLKKSVDQLASERESFFRQVLEAHLFLLAVETIIVITVMTLCIRRFKYQSLYGKDTDFSSISTDSVHQQKVLSGCSSPLKRHNSTNDLIGTFVPGKKRRPSEIVSYSGNYSELLIVEPAMPIYIEPGAKSKKRNRHRKSQNRNLRRSLSNPSITEDNSSDKCQNCYSNKSRSVSSVAGDLLGASSVSNKCENCYHFVPTLPTIISPVKLHKVPLQNVTNGALGVEEISQMNPSTSSTNELSKIREITMPSKEPFSFRKLLKFRKNEVV